MTEEMWSGALQHANMVRGQPEYLYILERCIKKKIGRGENSMRKP